MTSSNREESTVNVAAMLSSVRRKGVTLWSENGQLRYQAPRGVLTADDIERLRTAKQQILVLLDRASETQALLNPVQPRGSIERIPLAHSQLSHWYRYGLAQRRHLRQIASATRLRGHLDVNALRRVIDELVRRHEALRTQIVVADGVPMQEVAVPYSPSLGIEDLRGLPDDLREDVIRECFERLVLESIDVTTGPLFGVRLLRVAAREHVLLVAIEHMIADGVSMNILLRDLFVAYGQAVANQPFELPVVAVQFPDYALWQRREHDSRVQQHTDYWMKRLAECRRLRFPSDLAGASPARSGWSTVPVEINRELKHELREWCRKHRATLPMSVFAAYVSLVARWCGVQQMVVRYVTDGRGSPVLENTIGYFAYLFFLRISVQRDDTFLDVLRMATDEYCNAQERPHFGCIEARVPLPEFARGCGFNWVPRASGDDVDARRLPTELTHSPILFEHPMLKNLEQDIEPFVLFYDTDESIVGAVHFPLDRFSADSMVAFARTFLTFIRTLVLAPDTPVTDIPLQ